MSPLPCFVGSAGGRSAAVRFPSWSRWRLPSGWSQVVPGLRRVTAGTSGHVSHQSVAVGSGGVLLINSAGPETALSRAFG